MRIWSLLQRLGLVHHFGPNDVERAETENALRDHNSAMKRVEGAVGKGVREAQLKLRASIEHSRSSSQAAQQLGPDALARLLHDMKSSGRHTEP